MTGDAAPAVTTAARVRHVLGRLLGPWGWCLALLGAVSIAVPGGRYYSADVAATGHLPQAGRRLPPPLQSDAGFLADAAKNLPPRTAVWVDRAPPAPPGGARTWHPRLLAARWREPAFPVAERFHAPLVSWLDDDPVDGPEVEWSTPAWGVTARRRTSGWEFWGPVRSWKPGGGRRGWPGIPAFDRDADRWGTNGPFSSLKPRDPSDRAVTNYVGPWAWREREVRVSLWWFAGLPLLISVARLGRGVRSGWGDPRPAGRWRRAVRPFAATAAAIAAVAVAAGWGGPDRTAWVFPPTGSGCSVRSDPFAAWHPRFVRGTIDERGDAAPAWSVGDRCWGFQASRTRNSAEIAWPDRRTDDPDFAPPGTARTAVDLSLWYAFLPAALWSGTVLWRTRGGRMRPA